jgi:hypothetical protein
MYRHEIRIKPLSSEASTSDLLSNIAKQLSRQQPSQLIRKADMVEFRAGLFRLVSSKNLLLPISHGVITFEPEKSAVVYSLSYARVVWVTIIWLVFVLILFVAGAPRDILLVGPAMICFVTAVGLLTSILRFRALIGRCIEKSGFKIEYSTSSSRPNS